MELAQRLVPSLRRLPQLVSLASSEITRFLRAQSPLLNTMEDQLRLQPRLVPQMHPVGLSLSSSQVLEPRQRLRTGLGQVQPLLWPARRTQFLELWKCSRPVLELRLRPHTTMDQARQLSWRVHLTRYLELFWTMSLLLERRRRPPGAASRRRLPSPTRQTPKAALWRYSLRALAQSPPQRTGDRAKVQQRWLKHLKVNPEQ